MFRVTRSEQRTDMFFLIKVPRPGNACFAQAGQVTITEPDRGRERVCNMVNGFGGAGEITPSGTDLIVDRVV